jgi:hypothetical protein
VIRPSLVVETRMAPDRLALEFVHAFGASRGWRDRARFGWRRVDDGKKPNEAHVQLVRVPGHRPGMPGSPLGLVLGCEAKWDSGQAGSPNRTARAEFGVVDGPTGWIAGERKFLRGELSRVFARIQEVDSYARAEWRE